MRARNIKPSIFKNEVLGTADPLLTILFEGLWCEADRDGRLEDRPLRLKAEILPYRNDANVDTMLDWLAEHGFIARYEARNTRIIQVLKFSEHQRPHNNEVESVLPAMEAIKHNQGKKSAQPRKKALRSDSLMLIPSSLIPDSPSLIPDTQMPSPQAPAGLDAIAWQKWVEYRRQRKPAIKVMSVSSAMREMAALGDAQMAAVDHSIANGWQGLIAPKVNGSIGWRDKPYRKPKTIEEIEAEERARAN